jgi:TolB-like protein/DNA-binding winged helix-turn-helix (wHTH) protein/Flp pilus assembly protein TadD
MTTSKSSEMNTNSGVREEKSWVIDGWRLDVKCHCLLRGEDTIHLEPKICQLMAYLAERAGAPISREQLLEEVWPGTIVSDESLTSAVNKIRKAFDDSSQNPRIIETIPKMGYRLIAPVCQQPIHSEIQGNHSPAEADGKDKLAGLDLKHKKVISVAVVFMVLAVVTWLFIPVVFKDDQQTVALQPDVINHSSADESRGGSTSTDETTPSILVLPFRHIGKQEADDYFIDGMTVDIITELSRLSNLLVMANQTSLNFKGKNITPQEAGHELGVGYILDGSLRRAGDELRVNAQLIDVATGYPLWSERYDRKLDNIFEIQDEITDNIVRELAVRLTTQEQLYLRSTAKVDFKAYDLFLKGQDFSNRRSPEDLAEAIRNFEEAITLDPAFARAYGALAIAIAREFRGGSSKVPAEALNRALNLAKQGVEIDDSVPQVYWALGFVHLYRAEFPEAISAIEKSLELAPNYADGYGLLALIYNNKGYPKEAIKNITHGMKLNPYYSFDYPYNLGRANYLLGKYEQAVEELLKALERNEAALMPRLFLTAAYVKQNRIEDAEWEVEQLKLVRPGISLSEMRYMLPQKAELLQELLGDLKAAGMPE